MKLHYYIKGKDIPIYKGKLYIVASNDYEKVCTLIPNFEEIGKGELYGLTLLMNYKGVESIFIVLNFDHEYEKMTYGVIVHELRHAADILAKQRDLNTGFENTENNAYIMEWMANTVFTELIRWGFVPNRKK